MALNGPLIKFIDSKRTDLPFELSASNGNYISDIQMFTQAERLLTTKNL